MRLIEGPKYSSDFHILGDLAFPAAVAPLGLVEMLPHPREQKVLLGSWDPWSLAARESQTQAKMVDSETGALVAVTLSAVYSTVAKYVVFLLA